jgi:hypothetical protein
MTAWLGSAQPEGQQAWRGVVGFAWIIAAPLLAVINTFFVVREYRTGRRGSAALGAGLSLSTLIAAWAPLPGEGVTSFAVAR